MSINPFIQFSGEKVSVIPSPDADQFQELLHQFLEKPAEQLKSEEQDVTFIQTSESENEEDMEKAMAEATKTLLQFQQVRLVIPETQNVQKNEMSIGNGKQPIEKILPLFVAPFADGTTKTIEQFDVWDAEKLFEEAPQEPEKQARIPEVASQVSELVPPNEHLLFEKKIGTDQSTLLIENHQVDSKVHFDEKNFEPADEQLQEIEELSEWNGISLSKEKRVLPKKLITEKSDETIAFQPTKSVPVEEKIEKKPFVVTELSSELPEKNLSVPIELPKETTIAPSGKQVQITWQNPEQFVKDIGESMNLSIKDMETHENKRIQVTITPETLGEMEIHLEWREDKIVAKMFIQKEDIRELVERKVPTIIANTQNETMIHSIVIEEMPQANTAFAGQTMDFGANQQSTNNSGKINKAGIQDFEEETEEIQEPASKGLSLYI